MQAFLWQQGEFLLRILLAAVCGAMIGYERKSRNKEAGIRTHMIVAMGAALIMIVSKYGFGDLLGKEGVALDPSRIAAQIVTGVGFLGAGMIFMRKNTISGLTTAAGIWAISAIGMAIGSGLYLLGILTAFVILLIQITLHSNHKWLRETYKDDVCFVIEKDKKNIEDLQKRLQQLHMEILNAKVVEKDDCYHVDFVVNYPKNYDADVLMKLFQEISYIKELDV